MNDLENKYKAIKAKLRPYNILNVVNSGLVFVGLIFTIINAIVKNDTSKILNYVALGIFCLAIVGFVVLYLIFRNDLKEYKKIKDDMIRAKKQQ